ncbi:unnamed protein product [Dovyalis caffra]|uniref:Uncharacterized protein n=1 Tax=Dovyalis caffra TaxID=77055 RepID=A0AAV1S656_9ROSI|nr:unnamed protein product [Dovyalis caffra]
MASGTVAESEIEEEEEIKLGSYDGKVRVLREDEDAAAGEIMFWRGIHRIPILKAILLYKQDLLHSSFNAHKNAVVLCNLLSKGQGDVPTVIGPWNRTRSCCREPERR